MQKISLNLSSELTVNSDNKVTVNISKDEGNTLQIISDNDKKGLYAPAYTGNNAESGKTYNNGETEGINIGALGPWGYFYDAENDKTAHSTEIGVASHIHRCYTALSAVPVEGKTYYAFAAEDLIDMRKCDIVAPGDFIRVPEGTYNSLDEIPNDEKYHYFIAVSTVATFDTFSGFGGIIPYNDVDEAYMLNPEESW